MSKLSIALLIALRPSLISILNLVLNCFESLSTKVFTSNFAKCSSVFLGGDSLLLKQKTNCKLNKKEMSSFGVMKHVRPPKKTYQIAMPTFGRKHPKESLHRKNHCLCLVWFCGICSTGSLWARKWAGNTNNGCSVEKRFGEKRVRPISYKNK